MSFSTPHVESQIQFSPLTQDVENQNQIHVNDRHIVLEPYEEHFDMEAFVIVLRLAMVGMLLIALALRQRKTYQPTFDPIPPRIFLDSLNIPHLKVSEGELSSTWDVSLTISNVMNCSYVNIVRLEAEIRYEENKTVAMISVVAPQYTLQNEVFMLNVEETKKMYLKLSTTGWEKNQPIVEDSVVQAIAEDVQRGVTRFSLHMRVVGEVGLGDGFFETFTMFPKCSNLEVKFVAADQQGEAATMIDSKRRECVGHVEWGPVLNTE